MKFLNTNILNINVLNILLAVGLMTSNINAMDEDEINTSPITNNDVNDITNNINNTAENNVNNPNGNNVNITSDRFKDINIEILPAYEIDDLFYFSEFYEKFKDKCKKTGETQFTKQQGKILNEIASNLLNKYDFINFLSNDPNKNIAGIDNKPILERLLESVHSSFLLVNVLQNTDSSYDFITGILFNLHTSIQKIREMLVSYENNENNYNKKNEELKYDIQDFLMTYFILIKKIDKIYCLKQKLKTCKYTDFSEITNTSSNQYNSIIEEHKAKKCPGNGGIECLKSFAYNGILDNLILSLKYISYYINDAIDNNNIDNNDINNNIGN